MKLLLYLDEHFLIYYFFLFCSGGEPSESGPCPPGYYCPEGTKFDEEYACPNGTYNPHYSKWNVTEHCFDCTQGELGIGLGGSVVMGKQELV